MILGMNVLEFVLLSWAACTVLAWLFDFGPEIYDEQKAVWRTRHPKKEKVSENTVTMPVGSFDPDTTMKLPRIKQHEIQSVFVINKRPASSSRGRHAKV